MRNKRNLIALTLFLLCLGCYSSYPFPAFAGDVPFNFSGGSGKVDDPYLIGNADDIQALATRAMLASVSGDSYRSSHYLQTADISLSHIPAWVPIGIASEKPFTGIYDGGGHAISDLQFDEKAETPIPSSAFSEGYGLFGVVSGDAEQSGILKNIRVVEPFAEGYKNINTPRGFGVIVGYLVNGRVESCTTTGRGFEFEIRSSDAYPPEIPLLSETYMTYIGGIVGTTRGGYIVNCSNSLAISFRSDRRKDYKRIGGILGGSLSGPSVKKWIQLSDCRNKGGISVFGPGAMIGGIVASLRNGEIVNCLNLGRIYIEYSRNATVGGLVGGLSSGTIFRGYNKGSIRLVSRGISNSIGGISNSIGGIVGYSEGRDSGCRISESMNEGSLSMEVHYSYTGNRYEELSGGHKAEIFLSYNSGGIVGRILSGKISNVANTGDIRQNILVQGITSKESIGGIIGSTEGFTEYRVIDLERVINSAHLSSEGASAERHLSVGGLIGFNSYTSLKECYWVGHQDDMKGLGGGPKTWETAHKLTVEESTTKSTFKNWDFESIWTMPSDGQRAPVLLFTETM